MLNIVFFTWYWRITLKGALSAIELCHAKFSLFIQIGTTLLKNFSPGFSSSTQFPWRIHGTGIFTSYIYHILLIKNQPIHVGFLYPVRPMDPSWDLNSGLRFQWRWSFHHSFHAILRLLWAPQSWEFPRKHTHQHGKKNWDLLLNPPKK